ncbi:hypothetical protein BDV11DRAFT_190204 [Aspergillus similis]
MFLQLPGFIYLSSNHSLSMLHNTQHIPDSQHTIISTSDLDFVFPRPRSRPPETLTCVGPSFCRN